MGGVRKPFHVREKKGSAFWWYDFTIEGQRFRGPTTVAVGPGRGGHADATRESGSRWYSECHRQGIKADPQHAETGTMRLIAKYMTSELVAKSRKRHPRYAKIETLRLRLHVLPVFPVVTAITTSAWDTHVEELHAQGLKLDTIRKITISTRLFCRWCQRIGALALVPSLRSPSGEEVALEVAERRAFTRAERDGFLAALSGRPRRIYTVLLYTALRKSALERMLPRWIDWQTGYVTFPASAMKKRRAKSFYLHPLAAKAIREEMEETHGCEEDGRDRRRQSASRDGEDDQVHGAGVHGLPAKAVADRRRLGALPRSRVAEVLHLYDAAGKLDRPVFGPFDYDGHNGAARSGVFWSACRKAKIPLEGLTAHHVTRHTAATIAGNDGASLAELMRLGGWDSPAAAMRYMHASDEQARKAVERL